MSTYIKNQSCDMCHKIEIPLCTMKVGDTQHHLCYECLAKLILDSVQFASMNLIEEFKDKGYDITVENSGGYVIKKIPYKCL